MKHLTAALAFLAFGVAGIAQAGEPQRLTDQDLDRVTAGFTVFPPIETSFAFELVRFEATASQIRTGINNEAVVIDGLIADGWARANAWNAAARASLSAQLDEGFVFIDPFAPSAD